MKKEGIAWESDKKEKFKENPEQRGVRPETWVNSTRDVNGTRVDDEDVIVWMRVAGLPTFKKLYRIIEQDLEPGTYTFNITSRKSLDDMYHIILNRLSS